MVKDISEDIFVRLHDPTGMRSRILEAAKASVELAQDYENLVKLSKLNKKERFKLKILASEMESLLGSLDLKLPEIQEKKQDIITRKIEKPMAVEKDALSMELEEIQRRLNSLRL